MQQVNLYQPIFKQQEKVFSAKTLLQATVIVALGLAALYGYAAWQTAAIEGQLEAFERQRVQAQERVARVMADFPPKGKAPALAEALERRRAELAAKRRVIDVLDGPGFGNTEGFSEHLAAFARQRPEGLWLRRVGVGAGGREMVLEGSTHQPEQVPKFIQRLGGEASLSGVTFSHFVMSREPESPGQVNFVIRTRPESGEGTR
jgi:hypothetical protein